MFDYYIEVRIATFLDIYPFSLEELSQLLNLLFELSDELGVSIFVDDSLAHNLFGAISVPEQNNRRFRMIE